MVKHTVAKSVLCGFCLLVPVVALAVPPPAKTMYERALAHEQDVRALLNAADVIPDVLTEIRAVVAEYESLVQFYPRSGYSDNALWQAGTLSLDSYAKFNQPYDRTNGIRLLKKLAAAYQTSKLAKQVADRLARADGGGSKDGTIQNIPEDTIEGNDVKAAPQKAAGK